MTKNRSTGLIALVLGVVIAVQAAQLPPSTMAGDIGPAVFPFISAGILILCGLGMLITGGVKEASIFTKESLVRLAKIFAVVLLYILAMSYLGFLIPTCAVLFVLSVMFAEEDHIAWWKILVFAIVLTIAIYLLFHNVLNLKLPTNQLF